MVSQKKADKGKSYLSQQMKWKMLKNPWSKKFRLTTDFCMSKTGGVGREVFWGVVTSKPRSVELGCWGDSGGAALCWVLVLIYTFFLVKHSFYPYPTALLFAQEVYF